MIYHNCVLAAANNVLDWDLPLDLLPLTITNQAALLAGIDIDAIDRNTWDY